MIQRLVSRLPQTVVHCRVGRWGWVSVGLRATVCILQRLQTLIAGMSSLTLATCEPSTTAAAPLPQRVRSRRRVRGADQPSNPLAAVTAAVRTNEHTEQANTLLPEPSQGSSYFSARKFEYTDDHPADVQLHAWGDDLKEAFEQVALAMFRYETELEQ